jgi:hypothetical protein
MLMSYEPSRYSSDAEAEGEEKSYTCRRGGAEW